MNVGEDVIESLAIDANCILQAILRSKATDILRRLEFKTHVHTALPTFIEVLEYIPVLTEEKEIPLEDAFISLQLLPIEIHEPSFYQETYAEARRRIYARDPDDVPLLALALKLNCPIWTNDRDFKIPQVREILQVYTTVELLQIL